MTKLKPEHNKLYFLQLAEMYILDAAKYMGFGVIYTQSQLDNRGDEFAYFMRSIMPEEAQREEILTQDICYAKSSMYGMSVVNACLALDVICDTAGNGFKHKMLDENEFIKAFDGNEFKAEKAKLKKIRNKAICHVDLSDGHMFDYINIGDKMVKITKKDRLKEIDFESLVKSFDFIAKLTSFITKEIKKEEAKKGCVEK